MTEILLYAVMAAIFLFVLYRFVRLAIAYLLFVGLSLAAALFMGPEFSELSDSPEKRRLGE